MTKDAKIVVTGAAGFIGSCLVSFLNKNGYKNLILVDDFSDEAKKANWENLTYSEKIERIDFFDWINNTNPDVAFIYHLGARTDTTEFDYSVHEKWNVNYSKQIWELCAAKNIPLVYASSAATYGSGDQGYMDDENAIKNLHPMNPYGVSKNEFDKWALHQTAKPPAFAGLKFFNVYGPNEYHKGRMASVIFHAFNQINTQGFVKLFKSHRPDFKDGEQLRDFIYVKDVINICFWFQKMWNESNSFPSGIFNVGTGKARTFNDLVAATFHAMGLEPKIEYIDMPLDIRNTYQYFTEAKMEKLIHAGYSDSFFDLESGIKDYVQNYLMLKQFYTDC